VCALQEPPQVARYEPGQFYLAHFDAFDVTSGPGRECVATGGQRVATVLIYLNDVPPGCGGETAFPRLGRKFRPVRGTAVVFFPCTEGACQRRVGSSRARGPASAMSCEREGL